MKKEYLIMIIIASIILLIMTARKPIKKLLSRGYRNNNPGNIRHSVDKNGNIYLLYDGEVPSDDKDFKKFKSIEYGYRAIFALLNSYMNKGYNTIEKIISRYAPANENATESYINSVSNRVGILKDDTFSMNDTDILIDVVSGISKVENGIEPNIEHINTGLKLFKS